MKPATRARTITDLAELAGVSPGTVSRALAGSSLISAATRERIGALAREHDFQLNGAARNLRLKRTGAVGVMIPLGHDAAQPVSDPFFTTLLGLLADALTARGYDLLLSRVIPAGADWLRRLAGSGRFDGLILIGQSDQAQVIADVAADYRPMVVWGAHRPAQACCTVGVDNRLGGQMAVRHLLVRGARRLAFLGETATPEFADRWAGACAAAAAAGLAAPVLAPAPLTFGAAHGAIRAWLDGPGAACDGLFAASDVIALAALRALHEAGRPAPDVVRVVGFDDIPLASQAIPPLTTIRQDLVRAADLLVERLVLRIAGEAAPSVVLPPELVVRAST